MWINRAVREPKDQLKVLCKTKGNLHYCDVMDFRHFTLWMLGLDYLLYLGIFSI